jgi:hypothetical protein
MRVEKFYFFKCFFYYLKLFKQKENFLKNFFTVSTGAVFAIFLLKLLENHLKLKLCSKSSRTRESEP